MNSWRSWASSLRSLSKEPTSISWPGSSMSSEVIIRTATADDAPAIVAVLEGIASERIYTAIDKPWSAGQQRRHLSSLSEREAIHVAEAGHQLVGYQPL